jgi:hypothetical protein
MTLKVSLNTIKNQYPGGVQPDKQITGYRAFSNIIKTINANYNIDGGLTFSDVYGRMYYKEYAQYTTERRNAKITVELKKGFQDGVHLFTVLKGEGLISKKTRILSLKRAGDASLVRAIVQAHVKKELNV